MREVELRNSRIVALAALAGLVALGCGEPGRPRLAEAKTPAAAVAPLPEARPQAAGPLVVFLGDSLTAGFGLDAAEAYPELVAAELGRRGLPIRVVNAGVSGDTSAGGLARLPWLLRQQPDLLFVCLGGNDALRGQPLDAIEQNLRAIIAAARAQGVMVVLAGIQIPPNYGPEYTDGLRRLYPRLARELRLPLVPFLLEGVAARAELNQPDGIHPNARGQQIVARTVAEALAPLLR